MKKQPIYVTIKDYLTELIEENRGNPEYKLPSEMQIANKFNASRVSVRNAFSVLEKKNLIFRIRGKGTFINPDEKPETEEPQPNTIGCIVPNTDTKFIRTLLGGIKKFCAQKGYTLLTMISDNDAAREKSAIDACLDLRCKGLILFPSNNEIYNENVLSLSFRKYPVVLLDRKFKGIDIACFSTDHYNAMVEAVRTLKKRNLEQIAFITPKNEFSSSVEDRIKGFEDAMLECFGMFRPNNMLFIDNYTPSELEISCKTFLSDNPQTQAVIVNSGPGALAVLKAARDLGISERGNLSFVFFDDEFDDFRHILPIAHSVILQDASSIGFRSAQSLCEQIENGKKLRDEKFHTVILDYPEEA